MQPWLLYDCVLDEHSVFYVLTPYFLECIKELHGHDNAIYISFDGSKLYFMQSGIGGIFESFGTKIDVERFFGEWNRRIEHE